MKKIFMLLALIALMPAIMAVPEIDFVILGGDQVSLDIVGWIEGRVTDEDGIGIEGLDVSGYCYNSTTQNTYFLGIDTTAYDGNFKIEYKESKCGLGAEAWVEFDYLGEHYVSARSVIYQFNPDKVKTTISFGVPEYSTITLGLAVIAAGLGIIFLRRA